MKEAWWPQKDPGLKLKTGVDLGELHLSPRVDPEQLILAAEDSPLATPGSPDLCPVSTVSHLSILT